MKSATVILTVGLVVGASAFCGFYYLGTASPRELAKAQTPELAWLKSEFNLTDAELAGITKLHEAYQPHCEEMCRRINAQNKRLKLLLAATNQMTAEIEAAIGESAKLRGECQRDMLAHFLEVSRTMPPEQGKRYSTWIQERTVLPASGMSREK